MIDTQFHQHQRLLRFRAADGFLISALLVTRAPDPSEDILDVPVLLQVHGLLGHFLARGTPRLLPHALLERGFQSLSINTRLAHAGQMTSQGIFVDTIHDIDAAVTVLMQRGFRNIFVLGYSLGASMVVHWAANREYPAVRGLVLEAIGYSIPDSHRKRCAAWGSIPAYEAIAERARAVLGDDLYTSPNDETFVVYQARGPSRAPIHSEIYTYKTWWGMIGPEAYHAMAHRHIATIQLPLLLFRGEHDELVEDWEPAALARLVRDAGNPHVRVRQISKAGHDCMENPEAMVAELVQMMTTYAT